MTEEDLRRKISDDISSSVDLKLSELRKLQAETEARQKAEAAERKRAQEEKLDALLQLQVDQAEQQKKRQELWNRLLAALVTLLTAAAGGGIYLGTRQPTPEEKTEQARPVIERVEQEGAAIEKRIRANEKKVERLKDVALEQQVQISDEGEYTRDLIKALARTPSQAKALEEVDVPDSIPKAKKKADAIKRKKAEEKKALFEEDVDPFAGID